MKFIWSLPVIIYLFLPQQIEAQSNNWKNGLNVPLYIRTSMSFGYDSNFLRLSSAEKNDADYNPFILGDTDTYDSAVIRPEFRLNYNPVFFNENETKFTFKISKVKFGQSNEKSYSVFSFLVEQHLGPYQWLRFGYVNAPQVLLRYYRDKDSISRDILTSNFSNEIIYLTYSFKVYKKSWFRIKPRLNRQYFNQYFTEFDTEVSTLEFRGYTQLLPDFKLSAWYAFGKGDNTSYDDGLLSTTVDRSYDMSIVGAQLIHYPDHFFKSASLSLTADHRKYKSEISDDPLHTGREHIDYKASLLLNKDFLEDLSLQFKLNYRHRTTESEYNRVESEKSFSKFEIWLKVNYDFALDFYY
ncbi:MAG: hypothetical protein HOB17_09555 [Candidatus Marinimicrobia bacterium]|jgi:hypothetical protein|nr:hypothetical protein [Candidatus Neomarinimicrobiota bacterium]